jgi:hypothetical protein
MQGNKCVVSFADGDYKKKLVRLEQSLQGRFNGDFVAWTDYKDINCEPHKVIPYKFKAYAIKKAIEMGYEYILWCDSPIVAIKDIELVFEYIDKHGYVFFDNIGHPLGKWANDKSLEHFNVSREEAKDIKMIMACCMGFKVSNLTAARFLDDYIGLADKLYPGSWTDHRHDQTVASLIIHEYGMDIIKGQDTFFAYQSHSNVLTISNTVCLISH